MKTLFYPLVVDFPSSLTSCRFCGSCAAPLPTPPSVMDTFCPFSLAVARPAPVGGIPEAPLPPGWSVGFDPRTGRRYFIDHVSHATCWEDPRNVPAMTWSEPVVVVENSLAFIPSAVHAPCDFAEVHLPCVFCCFGRPLWPLERLNYSTLFLSWWVELGCGLP